MKRKTVHGIYGTLSTALVLTIAWQAAGVLKHQRSVAALAEIPSVIETQTETGDLQQPELMLATAEALSKGGQFEAAEQLLVRLIDQQKNQALGQAARFNLANHYLRQAQRSDIHGAQAKPLMEIAKQRYRDLLHAEPQDWDARYNLEVALRMAPEQPSDNERRGPPPKSVRVIVPDFTADDLP